MSRRFESLCRPATSVPSPLGRGGNPAGALTSPQTPNRQRGSNGGLGGGDTGSPTSWGFATPGIAEGGGAVASAKEESPKEDAVGVSAEGGVKAMAAEVSSLREENTALKKQLRKAKAEIKRLTSGGGGGSGGGQAAGGDKAGGGGGVARASENDGAGGNRGGAEGGIVDGAGGEGLKREKAEHGRRGRTPRESRSRKKMDIDAARATDAVVEAAAGGGQVASERGGGPPSPARKDVEGSSPDVAL